MRGQTTGSWAWAWALLPALAVVGPPGAADARDRRVCRGASTPAETAPVPAAARGLYERVAERADRRPTLGASPDTNAFCLTRKAIFFNPADLGPAETSGTPGSAPATARLAYALGAWRALQRNSRVLETDAAQAAGCALARLGVKGDALTTQLLDLRDWSGPHADARAWTSALTRGYQSCGG